MKTKVKKFWNLGVKRGADGSKHLDLQIHGVIDGGWGDEGGVDTKSIVSDLQQHLDAKTIGVRINSMGGSAFGGVALYNALQSHPGEVTCCVEGLAASAASLVAMAGKTIMGKGAMMMIHPPSTIAMGGATEFRKTADVLDKIQTSLETIYSAKTGLSAKDVNDLVNKETWMTAEEAVAMHFADAVGAAPATEGDDGDVGTDDGEGDTQMTADAVTWNGVTFPRKMIETHPRIMAMATKKSKPPISATESTETAPTPDPAPEPPASPEPEKDKPAADPAPASEEAPTPAPASVLSLVPPPAPTPPITRAELTLRAPELIAALFDEGHAAGAAAERARLQAIDDLGLKGCAELLAAAKYGDKPMDARDVAVAAIKAGQFAGAELLATRRVESRQLAAVVSGSPDQTGAAEQALVIKSIVDGGNARRGGSK